MDTSIEHILSSNIPYYQKLPTTEKPKFVERVASFIERKEFEGRQGLVVTDEMKAVVAASAVQLTFGMNEYYFPHFSKILLFPQSYYNRLTQQQHKGEVNFSGLIALSWKDLKEGFEKPYDNYNLGLHEMAHALCFDKFTNHEIDNFFEHYFDKWEIIAQDEYKRVKENHESFFRKYAGTNKMEFFAVCIEYFFESPEQMKKELPELYYHSCILLNQDLLAKEILKPRSVTNAGPISLDGIIYTSSYNKKILLTIGVLIIGWSLLAMNFYTNYFNTIIIGSSITLLFLISLFGKLEKLHFFENGYRTSSLFKFSEESTLYSNITSAVFYEKSLRRNVDLDSLDILYQLTAWLTQYDHILIKCWENNSIYIDKVRIDHIPYNDIMKLIESFNRNKIAVKIKGSKWKLNP